MNQVPERPSVLIVVNSTARRGAEVQGGQLGAELDAIGIPCRVVALVPGAEPSTGLPVMGTSPLRPSTLRNLRRDAAAVDVVIAYGSSTLPACAAALLGTRTPFIYRSIGDPKEWIRNELHRRRTGLLFRRAAHVAALWQQAATDIADLYAVPPSRISVIPNARSAAHFQPPTEAQRRAARALHDIDDDRPVIVSIGAFSPEKQIDRAIAATAHIERATMLVAGDGPDRPGIEEAIARLPGADVRLLGVVTDPVTLLHAADVVVVSSRTEGMPGVIIEAGLCGVPAVAPAVGSVPELVIDGVSGIVVASTDVESLASGISSALARRDSLGHAALEHMRAGFTWNRVIDRWVDLISRVADR